MTRRGDAAAAMQIFRGDRCAPQVQVRRSGGSGANRWVHTDLEMHTFRTGKLLMREGLTWASGLPAKLGDVAGRDLEKTRACLRAW